MCFGPETNGPGRRRRKGEVGVQVSAQAAGGRGIWWSP